MKSKHRICKSKRKKPKEERQNWEIQEKKTVKTKPVTVRDNHGERKSKNKTNELGKEGSNRVWTKKE